MSRLEELIEQLCPDGVEWVALDKVIISLNTGLNPRRFFKLNTDDATNYYVTIRELQNDCVVFSDKTDRINDTALKLCNNRSNLEVGDVLFSGTGTIGETAIITSPPVNWNIKEGVYAIKPNPVLIEPKFLMHLLKMKEIRKQFLSKAAGGTVKSVPMGELKKIAVPLPPLEVQQEIVRILDQFTELTTELTTKLTAELTARRKQYEYYKRQLFDDPDAETVPLNKVCNNVFSGRNKARLADGKYPVYGSTGIISTTNTPAYSKEQILIARVGANAGFVHIANGEYDVSDNTLIVDLKDGVSLKYIYYQLSSMNLHQYAKGGGQPLVTAGQIKELKIVIPALKKQVEVVSILDRFDAFCNDLTSGLPAEIEARRKQYEYYRDKLLTFKEIPV